MTEQNQPEHNHTFDLPYESKYMSMDFSGNLTHQSETKYQCSSCFLQENIYESLTNPKKINRIQNEIASLERWKAEGRINKNGLSNLKHYYGIQARQSMANNCTLMKTQKYQRIDND
tara:strand:- start:39 stop:389 length:351 start_codon:yes stop_codon:yes gene_type:complete